MKEHLMVQEQVENVWQHMVGVMCLNLHIENKLKKYWLFKRYPILRKHIYVDI